MALDRKALRFEIITPTGRSGAAEPVSVMFPATDGMVGVLPGRAPLIAAVGRGAVTVRHGDGGTEQWYVAGGFAHVRDDVVTVLAEACVPVVALDPEAIWDEMQQARRLPVTTDQEAHRRDEAVADARARFRLAQQHRRRTTGPAAPIGPEE